MIHLQYLFICFLGWFIGSYANAFILRGIQGEPILVPPSRFMLEYNLTKLLRFGKKEKDLRVNKEDIFRVLISIIGVLLVYFYGITVESIFLWCFIVFMIIVTIIDIKVLRIPNGMVGMILFLGLIRWVILRPFPWWSGILGLVIGGGSLFLINLMSELLLKKQGMGMGDVKLALACGLFLGIDKTSFGLFCAVYLAGFVLVILLLGRRIQKKQYIPFGPFLGGGFIISLLLYEQAMLLWESLLYQWIM